jgi:putative ABC transport system permease protein
LNVPLVSGRPFQPSDLGVDALPVAVVNEALADRLWPGQPVVDREVGLVTSSGDIVWLRVVGVAPEIQYEEFGEETEQSELNVFVPYSRTPFREMAILVRAENDPAAIATPVRDAIRAFAPGAPVFMVRTMREVRYMTSWEQRFFGRLLNAFAVAAVLLACLGIYGLVAYRSSRRTHEIGIRVALGAARKDVTRLLVGQGLALAVVGIGVGLVLSVGVSRALGSVLYHTEGRLDLYAIAAGLFTTAILLASYLPARKAATIDPMEALRRD